MAQGTPIGTKTKRGIKEEFARFCEDPTREGLRELLKHHTGERDDLDFKTVVPVGEALAKDVLGMANKSGGAIVCGVTESGDKLEAIGLSELDDKTELKQAVGRYLPEELRYEVLDFVYAESEYGVINGKRFRVIVIDTDPHHLPYLPAREGEKIKAHHVYTRHNASTVLANHAQLQAIINRRIETGYSTQKEVSLREHLADLKLLYQQIEPTVRDSKLLLALSPNISSMMGLLEAPNKHYPKEVYEAFVARMIDVKKQIIDNLIRRRPA